LRGVIGGGCRRKMNGAEQVRRESRVKGHRVGPGRGASGILLGQAIAAVRAIGCGRAGPGSKAGVPGGRGPAGGRGIAGCCGCGRPWRGRVPSEGPEAAPRLASGQGGGLPTGPSMGESGGGGPQCWRAEGARPPSSPHRSGAGSYGRPTSGSGPQPWAVKGVRPPSTPLRSGLGTRASVVGVSLRFVARPLLPGVGRCTPGHGRRAHPTSSAHRSRPVT